MLDHGEAKVLITDREFSKADQGGAGAVPRQSRWSSITTIRNSPAPASGSARSNTRTSSPKAMPISPGRCRDDEWDAISLNYTSGTTGDPKGVVYHHRGAYLLALGNVAHLQHGQASGLSVDAADVPLQRLVLSLDAVGRRRHACLPALGARRGDLRRHRRPQGHASVRRADRDVDAAQRAGRREAAAAARGRVHHRGGAAAGSGARGDGGGRLQRHPCLRPDRDLRPGRRQRLARDWDALPAAEQAAKKARQGVRYPALEGARRARPRDHGSRCRATARRWARSCSAATS